MITLARELRSIKSSKHQIRNAINLYKIVLCQSLTSQQANSEKRKPSKYMTMRFQSATLFNKLTTETLQPITVLQVIKSVCSDFSDNVLKKGDFVIHLSTYLPLSLVQHVLVAWRSFICLVVVYLQSSTIHDAS